MSCSKHYATKAARSLSPPICQVSALASSFRDSLLAYSASVAHQIAVSSGHFVRLNCKQKEIGKIKTRKLLKPRKAEL